jgi:hypothetical protein
MTRIVTALAIEAVMLAASLGVVADLAAHRRVERLGGVNIWNYRGPVAHRKQPNEIRLAFVGGTRAFSWGVAASETVSSSVAWQVRLATDVPGRPSRPIVPINLARLGALPASYAATIDRHAYLSADVICLYDDLGVAGATTADRASAVYDWTGYMPALPLVLREKGAIWQRSASPWLNRAGAVTTSIGSMAGAIDRSLAGAVDPPLTPASPQDESHAYAEHMLAAIEAAHRHARGVVVVLAPVETSQQVRNWLAIAGAMSHRPAPPWLRIVDLSSVLELYDDALRLDGWNFGAGGIAIAAEAIAPAVLALVNES